MEPDVVEPVRRGVPIWPGCGEGQRIEPLRRVRNFWYLRCLACHFGVRMAVSKIVEYAERRSGRERRRKSRGGMRYSDIPVPERCDRCNAPVAGWLNTPEALWVRCERCGRVTRYGPSAA